MKWKKEYPDANASEDGTTEHKARSGIRDSKIDIDLCISAIGNITDADTIGLNRLTDTKTE